MDDLDRQLIGLLRQDSRLPVAGLAAATKVSRATVKARIDRLVADGVIEAFTIRLGTELRQAQVRAIVLIEVQGKAADHVAQRLRGVPEVRALYSTNGRWDFVAELEDRDLASFDETLRRLRLIDGISSTETNILLNARKRAAP
jgi:DNA-binding Lrp family transcriptional regulator